jgi:glycerol kinase
MQFVADITRYTIRASQLAELSALGAVMSGMLGTGIAGSLEDLEQLAHQFEDYSPILDEELAQEYYAGWQRAVQMVL